MQLSLDHLVHQVNAWTSPIDPAYLPHVAFQSFIFCSYPVLCHKL